MKEITKRDDLNDEKVVEDLQKFLDAHGLEAAVVIVPLPTGMLVFTPCYEESRWSNFVKRCGEIIATLDWCPNCGELISDAKGDEVHRQELLHSETKH